MYFPRRLNHTKAKATTTKKDHKSEDAAASVEKQDSLTYAGYNRATQLSSMVYVLLSTCWATILTPRGHNGKPNMHDQPNLPFDTIHIIRFQPDRKFQTSLHLHIHL